MGGTPCLTQGDSRWLEHADGRRPRVSAQLLAALAAPLVAAALLAGCGGSTTGATPADSTSGGPGSAGSGGTGGATLSTSTPSTTTPTTSSSSMGGAGGGGGQGGSGGVGPLCPPDEDLDTLSDDIEGKEQGTDTDADGTPDYQDLDSDGDTVPDAVEAKTKDLGCLYPQNSDGVDEPDWQDTDSDNNGLSDRDEIYPDGSAYSPSKPPADTDGDNKPDLADEDNDNDSLLDVDELEGGVPVDSDGDGTADLDDIDSDGDLLADAFEGVDDADGDGTPAYLDTDSDADGLLDNCEAGPGYQINDPAPDTDNDGKYDFLDVDADGDGILDKDEDLNLNCNLEWDETNPFSADSDDDGASDLVETVLGSDPLDGLQTPGSLGQYYFVLPYFGPALPDVNIVPLKTDLNKGDVAFIVDTTASMSGAIQDLKTNLNNIVTDIKKQIPDLAIGIAGHDDFPNGSNGEVGLDLPFYVAGTTGYVSTNLSDNLGAILGLNVHSGGDDPESQIAAMYRALTDYQLVWDFPPPMFPSGAPGGTYGSLHFREGSLPILVGVTDAPFHNGKRSTAPTTLHDAYGFNGMPPYPTPDIDMLVEGMKARGAHYVGVSLANGSRNGTDPYEDMAYLVDQVGSYVSPQLAFGGANCLTGLKSAAIAQPDGPATADDLGGTCRLILDASITGDGVNTSVVKGVTALLKSIKLDIRPLANPDPADPLDAVETFIESIAVNAGGGVDEAEPGKDCIALNAVSQLTDIWYGPQGIIKQQDGVNETALGIVPSQKVCFKVVPKPNVSIQQTCDPQVFSAILTIKAKNGNAATELLLGAPRVIAFIIPPSPQAC